MMMTAFSNSHEDVNLILYHASDRVKKVEEIQFPGPRDDCDFGAGFYLAEKQTVAEEWAIRGKNTTPVVNSYTFTAAKDQILYLTGIDWLRVVVGFREKKYKVNLKSPIIHGIIADDRMIDVMPLFMGGIVGDKRLIKCLDYCKLGSQYLIRMDAKKYLQDRAPNLMHNTVIQEARRRFINRQSGMDSGLREIIQTQEYGEKFIQHILEMGDYNE